MKIIKNFLPKEEFYKIKETHFSNEFPWYLHDGVNHQGDGNYQFVHTFYRNGNKNSDHFKILTPLLNKLKIDKLLRVKSNLNFKTKKIIEHGFHKDFNLKEAITAVYYINTNNGYTLFKNKKILSEENTLISFKCSIKHSGSTCTNAPFRAVMNINYIPLQ